MPINRTFHIQSGNKTLVEVFDDIWRHFGGRMKGVVKFLTPQLFDTLHPLCSKELPYVLPAAVFLDKVFNFGGFPDEPRELSLRWVLLDRAFSNVHFVR